MGTIGWNAPLLANEVKSIQKLCVQGDFWGGHERVKESERA